MFILSRKISYRHNHLVTSEGTPSAISVTFLHYDGERDNVYNIERTFHGYNPKRKFFLFEVLS